MELSAVERRPRRLPARGWRRTTLLVGLALVAAGLPAFAPTPAGAAETCDAVAYAYDAAGRLVGVSDPAGQAARYSYDKVGNTTAVTNLGAPAVAVQSVVPARAAAGASVTISGGCFAPTPADNVVRFNGTPATVTAAAPYRLVATVPAGATTGTVSVTVNGATGTSPDAFTVAETGGPAISSVTPSIVVPGATLTIAGSGFAANPADNVVAVNTTAALVTAASPTSLTVQLPPAAVGAGRLSVRTPDGRVAGPDVFVLPAGYTVAEIAPSETGRLSIDGPASRTVTLAPNKVALLAVDVPGGGRVNAALSGSGFGNCGVTVAVYDPRGALQGSRGCLGTGGYAGTARAAQPGTYLVLLDSQNAAGSATVTVTAEQPDPTVDLPIGGGPRPLALNSPGQNGAFTFTGTAGQEVSATFTFPGATLNNAAEVTVRAADRTVVRQWERTGSANVYETFRLPYTGAYRMEVDPVEATTGTFTAQLYAAPQLTAEVTIDAAQPIVLTTTAPGQNPRFTFAGAAGQRVSFTFPGSTMSGYISVSKPDGTLLRPVVKVGVNDFFEPAPLPATGTYTIDVNPDDADKGAFGVQLFDVTDVSLATAVGADPVLLEVTKPGQNGTITFAGTAGQRVSMTHPGSTMSAARTVLKPDGTFLIGSETVDPGPSFELLVLPVTGTYTVGVNPGLATIGKFGVRLRDAADVTGSATIGAIQPTSVTTTEPGQNAAITFTGTAGQRFAATFPDSISADVTITGPGAAVVQASTFVTATTFLGGYTLPADGSYTIAVDPRDATTGAVRVLLSTVPADATATVPVPGSVPVTTSVAGQDAAVSLPAATAGMVVTIRVTPFALSALSLKRPDGAVVRTANTSGPLTWSNQQLAVAGTWQVHINPSGSPVGTATVQVTVVSGAAAAAPRAPPPARPTPAGLTPSARDDLPRKQPAVQPTARPRAAAAEDPAESWVPDRTNLSGVDWRRHRAPAAAPAPPPLQAPAGQTAVSGRVLLLTGRPLAGVTLTVDGRSARSDRTGRFLLTGLAPGRYELHIDGRTASRPGREFGVFEAAVELTGGHTLVLPDPVWMTRLDTRHAVSIPSPTTRETVLTTPLIPGFEVRLPAGTVIKDEAGKVVRKLSITPIPVNQPPFALPKMVQTPVYFTVQPGGSYVLPAGARIVYPNTGGLAPGTPVPFWNYDPEKGWYVYGHGTVTADGRQVVPDAGTRVYEFTGAMINTTDSPALLGFLDEPIFEGDPVDLATGLLVDQRTDLSLDDVMPIQVTRTHRQLDAAVRPFGRGANFGYGLFLHSKHEFTEVDLVDPGSHLTHFVRISPGGLSNADALFRAVDTTGPFQNATIHWNGVGWDLTRTDGLVYVFGEQAPLQAIRDRHGNQITITRTSALTGNITQVTSPNGKWIRFSYAPNTPRITEATDSAGRTVRYTYDTQQRLATVTAPGQTAPTRYAYNAQHALTTITDPRNVPFLQNTYDAAGRVETQQQADGGLYRYAYQTDAQGRTTQTTITDPEQRVRRVAFDPAGRPVRETVAAGTPLERTSTVERDPASGHVLAAVDPFQRRVTYTYDAWGNVTSATQLAGTPSARTVTLAYDGPFHQLSSATDALQHTTEYGYDATGELASVTDAEQRTWHYSHDSAGRLATAADPVAHAAGQPVRFGYDRADLVAVTDPLDRTARFFLDAVGRTVTSTEPSGATSVVRYDTAGNVASTTDPLGNTTTFDYDADRRLTRVVDARGDITRATRYDYDDMDRVTAVTDPLNAAAHYGYDRLSRLTSMTDRRGKTTTTSYDALGRITSTRYGVTPTGPESSATYGYDSRDRLAEVADTAAGTTTWSYDAYNRPTSESGPGGQLGFDYDAADRRTSLTVPGQQPITYTYDKSDLLRTTTQGSAVTSLEYDAAGRVDQFTRSGVVADYGYDTAGQLTAAVHSGLAGVIGDLRYAYQPDGRIAAVRGGLAQVAVPATAPAVTYDVADRLTSRGGQAFDYDAEGNLVSDGTRSYSWNARGQLTGVTGGGADVGHGYDPLGRRATVSTGSATTTYRYDGPNLVQEQAPGGTANRQVVGLDGTLQRTDAAGARTPITDHLGSVLGLVDGTGNLVTRYRYDPYGAVTPAGTSSGNTQQFAGREYDSNAGLLHNRARYYSPTLGRFISQDPTGLGGGSTNLYNYADSDPVNAADPTGTNPAAGLILSCVGDVVISAVSEALLSRRYTYGDAIADCVGGALGHFAFMKLGKAVAKALNRGLRGGTRMPGPRGGPPNTPRGGGAGPDGGRPDGQIVFSGHGFPWMPSDGYFTIPEGTWLLFYCCPFGGAIENWVGNLIELGTGEETRHLWKGYGPGETIPNLTLAPPRTEMMMGRPVTVDRPTPLSELVRPNMGVCHWAACGSGWR